MIDQPALRFADPLSSHFARSSPDQLRRHPDRQNDYQSLGHPSCATNRDYQPACPPLYLLAHTKVEDGGPSDLEDL